PGRTAERAAPSRRADRAVARPDRDRAAQWSDHQSGCAGGRANAAPRACGVARMIGPQSGPMQRQAVSALGPSPGVRVWLACGRTDMRKGMDGLAMLAQQVLNDDPFGGAVFAFRGRRGGIVKLLWYDGQGLCLYTKRLERGHFVWPVTDTGR